MSGYVARLNREPWAAPPCLLLSVDPGATYCGVAAWVDCILVDAGRIRRWSPESLALAVWAWFDAYAPTAGDAAAGDAAALVVEDQQGYPGRGGRRADLDRLRAVVARLAIVPSHREVRPRPSEWKGAVPKGVHARRVRALLTPAEAKRVPWDDHDAVDAVALGLWALRRAGRGGVRPTASPG